jgi:peptidyl-prolyl cis-trans isomerase C
VSAAAEIDGLKPLPSPLPDVAAMVNGQPIALRSVEVLAKSSLATDVIPVEKRPAAYRYALDRLVTRELMFQEALARRIEADTRAVERAYDQARLPYRDETSWARALANQGLSPRSYKTELRVQKTVDALLDHIAGTMPPVTDAEVAAYYETTPSARETGERVSVSHILLRRPTVADPVFDQELRDEADRLLARVRAGADFAQLARTSSQDPDSATVGGVLPPLSRGEAHRAFEDAAFALAKPGDISPVVQSDVGFHIIKLNERLPSEPIPLEDVREELRRRIADRRLQQTLEGLLGTLRAKGRIETFL